MMDTQFFRDSLEHSGSRHVTFSVQDEVFTYDPYDSLFEVPDSDPVVPPDHATHDKSSTSHKLLFSLNESKPNTELEELETDGRGEMVPMANIQYQNQRDRMNTRMWSKLDVSINGTDWKPKACIWINLPTVRQHYPAIFQVLQDSIWSGRGEEEADLMFCLRDAVQKLYLQNPNT